MEFENEISRIQNQDSVILRSDEKKIAKAIKNYELFYNRPEGSSTVQ